MSRAPYVMGKSIVLGRSQKIEDTTMGWRFGNSKLKELYGVRHHAPRLPKSVAEQFNVNRADPGPVCLGVEPTTHRKRASQRLFSKEIVAS